MISPGLELAFDAREQRFPVEFYRDRFSVYRFGAADDLAAEMLPDRLVAETNTQDRHATRKPVDHGQRDTGTVRCSGAGRNKYLFRRKRFDFAHRYLVVPENLHFGAEFAQVLDEVIGKGIVVVYDEQHRVRPLGKNTGGQRYLFTI